MTAAAAVMVIIATLPLGPDPRPVAEHLRAAAVAAGCGAPRVAMRSETARRVLEITVECRMPGADDRPFTD